jgi:hypothetical protein
VHGTGFWRAKFAAAIDSTDGTKLRVLIPKMKFSIQGKNLSLNKLLLALAAGALLLSGPLLSGCKQSQESAVTPGATNGLVKIRVGYIGLTCEAPIYMAVEKGFLQGGGPGPGIAGQMRLGQLQGRDGPGGIRHHASPDHVFSQAH